MSGHKKSLWQRLGYIFAPGDAKGVGFFDRLVLTMMGAEDAWVARPDTPRERRLLQMITEQSARGGFPPPKLIIYESNIPNAASIISGHVVIGTNLLDIMTEEQVAAVLGHELSHHRHINRDMPITMGMPLAYEAALAATTPYALRKSPFDKSRLAFAAASSVGFGACVLLPRAWQRASEFEADKESVIVFRNQPKAMIGALSALETRVHDLYKDAPHNSHPNGAMNELLATHPKTDARKMRLELLDRRTHAQERGEQVFTSTR